jgi:hypothetical protein
LANPAAERSRVVVTTAFIGLLAQFNRAGGDIAVSGDGGGTAHPRAGD